MSSALNVEEILALLPHRYPIMLVDRILELEPGKHVIGLKNVTYNEQFFTGHFPGQPVMPGVLIIEAMAQVAGVMMLTLPQCTGNMPFLASVDKTRFRKPVIPGDTLITEANIIWLRGQMGKVSMIGRVNGSVVVEGEMTFVLKGARSEGEGDRG